MTAWSVMTGVCCFYNEDPCSAGCFPLKINFVYPRNGSAKEKRGWPWGIIFCIYLQSGFIVSDFN